ncbi:MAG: PDZ domain-containing protein [Gemmataceae bacterium]
MFASKLSTAAVAAALIVACHTGIAGAHTFGVWAHPSAHGGMHVHSVNSGSRAEALGLQAGDRILNINGFATSYSGSIRHAIHRADNLGLPLRVVIVRFGCVQVLREDTGPILEEYSARPGGVRMPRRR